MFRISHTGRGARCIRSFAPAARYLILNSINAPLNPGNPYNWSKTQTGFGTMGQPDIAATLTAVAREALDAVWYQKSYVHLRHRPESGGAIVHLLKVGEGNSIQGHVSDTVLNSQAVQTSFMTNNSFFLSQAFPEGSPTHPAYPTGHGAVAGACITALKFFFDGGFVVPNAKVPSPDGTMLNNYTGSDAGQLTVNGELHKLAHNISASATHPCRYSLAQRYGDVDPARRGARIELFAGPRVYLQRVVHSKAHQTGWQRRDDLQSVKPRHFFDCAQLIIDYAHLTGLC